MTTKEKKAPPPAEPAAWTVRTVGLMFERHGDDFTPRVAILSISLALDLDSSLALIGTANKRFQSAKEDVCRATTATAPFREARQTRERLQAAEDELATEAKRLADIETQLLGAPVGELRELCARRAESQQMVAVLRGQLPKLRQELAHRRFAAVSIGEQLAVEKWLALTAEADAARQAVAAILSRAGAEQLAALVTLEKLRGDGRALDSMIRAFLEYELPAVTAATAPAVFAADPAALPPDQNPAWSGPINKKDREKPPPPPPAPPLIVTGFDPARAPAITPAPTPAAQPTPEGTTTTTPIQTVAPPGTLLPPGVPNP